MNLASKLAYQTLLDHLLQILPHGADSLANLDVLEVGCGTGPLSLMFAPHVHSLTAVDAAPGMIEALNIKLSAQSNIRNVLPVCAVLADPDDMRIRPDPLNAAMDHEKQLPRRFDLI